MWRDSTSRPPHQAESILLERTQIREAALSPDESGALTQWCRQFKEDPYLPNHDEYDRRLSLRLDKIPENLKARACSFGDKIGSAGILIVHGLPIPPDLTHTPSVPYSEIRALTGTECLLLGIGMLVGEVIGLKAWRGGDRVHNVYPLPADAETMKASGSVRLAMHSELAFRPGAPDALALLCLRAGTLPPSTAFCDLRPLWDRLDAIRQSHLMEPAFGFPRGPVGSTVLMEPKPIATLREGGLRFQYDNGLRGATPKHEEALRFLRDGIEETAAETTLAAGDFVLIDNLHMVHSRTRFSPRYDGNDRWLQRCLMRSAPGRH
jgi:L-asparagine oxygenase